MLKGFKQFLLRGNVMDLAVAVVIGGAFGAVVAALVKDLLTPLIAAIQLDPKPAAGLLHRRHRGSTPSGPAGCPGGGTAAAPTPAWRR